MRPTLVLAGGWGHPRESLEGLVRKLEAHFDVSVTVPDPATSVLPEDASDSEPVLLVGWSLGALLAMMAALDSPKRVRGLVLASCTPCFCSVEDFPHGTVPARLRALRAALRRDLVGAICRFWSDCALPHEALAWRVPDTGASPASLDPTVLARGLVCLHETDIRSECGTLRVPSSVLHGRADRIIPWQAGEWLARQVPGARWTLVEGVGHDLPLRHPESVVEEACKLVQSVR